MRFITQGKTNRKFLMIVFVLAAIAGGGILWWQKTWEPPQVLEFKIPPRTESETAGWQTYRNEEYGFEVKYPAKFTASSTGPNFFQQELDGGEEISGTHPAALDVIIFDNKVNGKFIIEIYDVPFNKLSESYPYGGECGSQFADKNIMNQLFNINNIDILERIQEFFDNKIGVDYCFLSGTGNLIALKADNLDFAELDKFISLFDRMLSTFRFLE